MEADRTPNYTPSPQDVVTKALLDVIQTVAQYEEELMKFRQVTPETTTRMVITYNTLRRLVSGEIDKGGLVNNPIINIKSISDFIEEVKKHGYFNTRLNIAH